MNLCVEIYANRMILTSDEHSISVNATEPFTTTRLLVGHFEPAVNCLKECLQQAGFTGFFKRAPKLHIIAREKTEGGLSEVEERCIREVGLAAGARDVDVSTS